MVWVDSGRREERGDLERHRTLGSIKYKQLTPDQTQQRDLISNSQIREERYVTSPLHSAEQQTSRQLADVLDAHYPTRHVQALLKSCGGVRLCPQKEADKTGQERMAVCNITAVQRWMLWTRLWDLRWRDATPLYGCWEKVKRFIQHVTHALTVNTSLLASEPHGFIIVKFKFLTRTLASHADFDALPQPTVLALVAVMLIYGTIARSPASVAEVTPNTAFEERLAPLTGEHSIVFPWRFVAANRALDLLHIFFRRFFQRFCLLRAPGLRRNHCHTKRQIRTVDIITIQQLALFRERARVRADSISVIARSAAKDYWKLGAINGSQQCATRADLLDLKSVARILFSRS